MQVEIAHEMPSTCGRAQRTSALHTRASAHFAYMHARTHAYLMQLSDLFRSVMDGAQVWSAYGVQLVPWDSVGWMAAARLFTFFFWSAGWPNLFGALSFAGPRGQSHSAFPLSRLLAIVHWHYWGIASYGAGRTASVGTWATKESVLILAHIRHL